MSTHTSLVISPYYPSHRLTRFIPSFLFSLSSFSAVPPILFLPPFFNLPISPPPLFLTSYVYPPPFSSLSVFSLTTLFSLLSSPSAFFPLSLSLPLLISLFFSLLLQHLLLSLSLSRLSLKFFLFALFLLSFSPFLALLRPPFSLALPSPTQLHYPSLFLLSPLLSSPFPLSPTDALAD